MITKAWRRRLRPVWPVAQQTAAAVVAWLVAVRLAGHPDPFFAPVAAVIGLNATLGRRGSNAVGLMTGVVIGVIVGELALWVAPSGLWSLAVSTFVAILVARAVNGARIVQAQAGVSAVLVTVLGNQGRGWDRLLDAVIGSTVALVFSQLLFVPEPLRLLRRAETAVLSVLANSLETTAGALEHNNPRQSEQALVDLRAALREVLAELTTTREASARIVRHSITWRLRAAPLVAERERADQLDLLAGSCLLLTRTVLAVPETGRGSLAEGVRRLAGAVADLADDPGSQPVRQDAATEAGHLADWLVRHGGQVPAQSAFATACAAVRMVALDVMVFAGADPQPPLGTAQPRQ